MNRKDFLKSVGLIGAGLSLPLRANDNPDKLSPSEDCVLVPSETAGPFPLDLGENSFFFRQDITEGQEGVRLKMKMRIVDVDGCTPMPNVRVNIWHCDKNGIYSGYNTGSNQGNTEDTHLRGYQIADANGEVEFVTVFPGIYPGRICHIHFQVFVSSSYSAVSQFTFDVQPKNQLYADNSEVYGTENDPVGLSQDFSFADGYEHQLATLEKGEDGYESFLQVAVDGSTKTNVGYQEREIYKVMELGEVYPNPFKENLKIPILLKKYSNIELEIWDLQGRKIIAVNKGSHEKGKYTFDINYENNLAVGNYILQVVAKNSNGVYKLQRVITRK
ncbi:MAG: T9SS type A sorting domain-containing protein [Chlorobiota bacterium]